MTKRLYIIALLCVTCLCAHAETIVLRTGARVQGTIVFQNEEVVIIRNAEGARFQYPKADVQEILADDAVQEEKKTEAEPEEEIKTRKKASILLEIGVPYVYVPGENIGAGVSADLLVGTHHIGDKHIFVGGGLGYHGMFLVDYKTSSADNVMTKYNFLPIQATVRIPFIEGKHSPVGGLSVGYGVALSKAYVGGLYAGVDLGYRYQANPKTAIAAVFYAQFQQVKKSTTEVVETNKFENFAGRSILSFGAKFALYF